MYYAVVKVGKSLNFVVVKYYKWFFNFVVFYWFIHLYILLCCEMFNTPDLFHGFVATSIVACFLFLLSYCIVNYNHFHSDLLLNLTYQEKIVPASYFKRCFPRLSSWPCNFYPFHRRSAVARQPMWTILHVRWWHSHKHCFSQKISGRLGCWYFYSTNFNFTMLPQQRPCRQWG